MGSTFSSITDLQGTYTVFTGTDIYTVFADQIITTLQGISYSITRQKAPIYTMGSPDFRGVARSKRGIAGSMILTTFDRHALADFMRSSEFAAKIGSMETTAANPNKATPGTLPYRGEISGSIQAVGPYAPAGTEAAAAYNLAAAAMVGGGTNISSSISVIERPMFTDQLLPFDVTLVGSNEVGISAAMRIYGLEILNEGSGFSVDDTSNEVQMTYLARFITPWTNQQVHTAANPVLGSNIAQTTP